jgi:hypothetical protein
MISAILYYYRKADKLTKEAIFKYCLELLDADDLHGVWKFSSRIV